ncbi:MAG: hypothetical protein MR276_02665, partial [Chlamydia suis]|nr:hypothetical protein [Chlamydia suis]
MSKKHKPKKALSSSQSQVDAHLLKKDSPALQELQNVMISFSQDLPLAQMLSEIQD